MKKVVLALADRQAEDLVKNKANNYQVIGITTHSGGILDQLRDCNPDILLVRDNIPGNKDIVDVLSDAVNDFPKLLIIVLSYGRYEGDPVLATFVMYGIYNILYGDDVNIYKAINLFENPMTRQDVKYLLPKGFLDEDLNKVSFKTSVDKNNVTVNETKVIEKQVFTEKQLVVTKHTRQAVVGCLGTFPLVGNSTLALNLSIIFAKNGYKTILVEMDPYKPCLEMWLCIGKMRHGIETVLEDLSSLDETIVNVGDLLKSLPDEIDVFKPLLKRLPKQLDFLMFSEEYADAKKPKEIFSPDRIRELLTSLIFHKRYDLIILDLSSNMDNPFNSSSLLMCNNVLHTIIPDYSVVSYTKQLYDTLESAIPNITNRFKLVLNQYQEGMEFSTHFLEKEPDYILPISLPLRFGQSKEIYLPAAVDFSCAEYISKLELIANDINPININRDLIPARHETFLKRLLKFR